MDLLISVQDNGCGTFCGGALFFPFVKFLLFPPAPMFCLVAIISYRLYITGIPQESFTSIFRPFEMSDESSAPPERTTRLGLALVKGLVTILAGRVWLESQVGKGTTFYVEVRIR
jgi:signal transduction histidine kinase